MINWEDCVIDQVDRTVEVTRGGHVIVRMALGDRAEDWTLLERRDENDEIETRWRSGPLEITWRHSAELVWSTRIAITNTATTAERVELPLWVTTGEDRTVWAVRSDAEASIAVLGEPTDTLWFDLVQGSVLGAGAGTVLGNLTLAPGQQHITRLRADWVGDLAARSEGRHSSLPHWDFHHHQSTVFLEHPDLAVIETGGRENGDGLTELEGGPGERVRTRLAGARGTIDFTIGFAPSVDEAVCARLQSDLTQWRSTLQGLAIPTPAQAVLAQHALASGGPLPDREQIAAAVEGAVARFRDEPSVLSMVLLAQQAVLTGDRDLAQEAVELASVLTDTTGFTLTWTRLLAAATLTGAELDPFLARQHALLSATAPDLGIALLLPGAELEVQRIARRLGYGLRGSRIGLEDPDLDAYEVALLSQWFARRTDDSRPELPWAVDHGEDLVIRHRTRLCHLAANDALSDEALAWLLLADDGG
ncbi:hypothetical protein ACOKSZ_04545 [Propionibacteriaceae bacterium Y1685]